MSFFFFFFNDTATTEIYTLSLHDALPIFSSRTLMILAITRTLWPWASIPAPLLDRKSTRLNSSHSQISYAVFCLKKKNKTHITYTLQPLISFTLHNTHSTSRYCTRHKL